VRYARSLCPDVEFSPEDASRTELDFLGEVVEAVIRPAHDDQRPGHGRLHDAEEYYEIFAFLQKVRGADRVTFSAHCHNDLGMAVANSLPQSARCPPGRVHDQRHR